MITWMKEFIWAPKNAVEKYKAIVRKLFGSMKTLRLKSDPADKYNMYAMINAY